jgi:hypothetical protein
MYFSLSVHCTRLIPIAHVLTGYLPSFHRSLSPSPSLTAQVREAISKESAEGEADPGLRWVEVVDKGVLVLLVGTFLYYVNQSSGGDLGRVLAGLFPKETEALGLKHRLEKVAL